MQKTVRKNKEKIAAALLGRLGGRTGMTLVELLVALSIFGIFMAVIMGSFVQVLATERATIKLLESTDNLGVAIEQMSREIRVGSGFSFDSSSSTLSFSRPDPSGNDFLSVAYSLRDNRIARSEDGTTSFITSPAVQVTYFHAKIDSNVSPGVPTKVQLVIGVTATNRGVSMTRYIQTTVSQRTF